MPEISSLSSPFFLPIVQKTSAVLVTQLSAESLRNNFAQLNQQHAYIQNKKAHGNLSQSYANKRTHLRLFRSRLLAPIHTLKSRRCLNSPLLAFIVFAMFTEIHNLLSFFTGRMENIWSHPLGVINLHIFKKCWVTISNSPFKITQH